ncbi:MAG: ATPase, T2SS/T4P/T4SS family [bacterium]|nr:ATPase, T2SS/T4P/T4SS family [bacterium]
MPVDSYRRKKKRLGDLLVNAAVITQAQLMEALEKQKKTSTKLGETLIDLGYTSEYEIAKALHLQLGYEMVKLSELEVADTILNLVGEQVLRKHVVMPFAFGKDNANVLRVAMSNPLDIIAMDDLAIITNMQIEPVVTTTTEVMKNIDKYYGNAEAMAVAERYTKEKESQYKEEEKAQKEDVLNAPIVVLVNTIIEQGVRQRASDIHIEPLEKKVRVRYRIDGVLKEAMVYNLNVFQAIIARIKIIGDMDIAEKRKPQDGRITSIVDRKEYDIRVSILPTVFGEKIVLRITAKKALNKDKKELGLSEKELAEFNQILKHPYGMLLVTGPTGSGKSTTLYTALSELNTEHVNIVTLEDPVEANIDGINQVQTNDKAGVTFASGLRSILRQDPDIIMIGEIRDNETAQIAVKAAITGHLVVSTLHTNSAASTIARLEDMGIESYLLADATVGIIAQRLVRRLCPSCKKSRLATLTEKKMMQVPETEEFTVYDPAGCNSCNGTGYYGRVGVYEIMRVTPELKVLISQNATAMEIQKRAEALGMSSLRDNGIRYVREGITSMEEVRRITYE